ncbi:hypothetical protein KJ951_04595, partial [Patescibacteria group bacterium]|nr:hypothetical protein [Patescibacteria group bacterium]
MSIIRQRKAGIIHAAITGLFFVITLAGCQSAADNTQASLLAPQLLAPTFATLQTAVPAGGAIINPDNPDETLNAIPNKENYQTVVLLAATGYSEENEYIFTYSAPGALGGPETLNMDAETIKTMTDVGITTDLGAIKPQSAWNSPLITEITKNFPGADFIFLSINENLPNPQAAAYALKSYLPEKSLVLA